MRLAAFVDENFEHILQEWERFARTIDTPGKQLDPETLGDHAAGILRTVVADLRTRQSTWQRTEESKRHRHFVDSQTSAESHAATRLHCGFTLGQMISEYRALRASVLKLWMAEIETGTDFETDDVVRFNEAIDIALAESVAGYSTAVEASRNIFLGILGHDLRGPLNAIMLGVVAINRMPHQSEKLGRICSMIQTSVDRATRIVGDLLDFTRSQQASGIPITRDEIDLVPICRCIVDEVQCSHPDAQIRLEASPSATGWFDGSRLEQVFANLITNAVRYGAPCSEITVSLETTSSEVIFAVHNYGPPISADKLSLIFNPMERHSQQVQDEIGPLAGLGLGLFIAAEITSGHDGFIDVTSNTEEGTKFVVRLPRHLSRNC